MNRDPSIHGDKVCQPETTVKIQIKNVTFQMCWFSHFFDVYLIKESPKGPEPLWAICIEIKNTWMKDFYLLKWRQILQGLFES